MSNLQLRTQMEFPKVDRTIAKDNHLMISVTAPELESNKRVPVQIVLVLDVSGSMGDPCTRSEKSSSGGTIIFLTKSKLEVMKAVATKLVGYLRDTDRISIVTFDSYIKTVANGTGAQKEAILTAISKLYPGNMTNTSGGITEGYEQVKTDFVGSTRVLVMTDGHANHGVSDSEGLKKICANRPGTAVLSTFGFGNDANQELLADMAKAGNGNYHYVEDPDQVRDAFAEELGGAISCVAQNIKLTLKPNKDVKIAEVLNDFKVEDVNGEAVITAEDIYAGETKHILVRLSLPAVPKAKPRASTIVTLNASWFNVTDTTTGKAEETVKVSYVKTEEADTKPVLAVAEQLAILKTAKGYQEASRKADANDFDAAKVIISGLTRTWADLKEAGSTLGQQGIMSCENIGASLSPENYTVGVGNAVRYSSSNSLRSRSAGKMGVASLMSKGSVVRDTVERFSDEDGNENVTLIHPTNPSPTVPFVSPVVYGPGGFHPGTVTTPSIPSPPKEVKKEEKKESSFAKERIRK